MRLLRGLLKASIMKRIYTEVRRPENQARAKRAVASMRDRRR